MCIPGVDPLTMLIVGGTAISAAGSLMEGQSAKALADAQAAAYEQQALADKRATGFEIARETRRFQTQQGQDIAQIGASGVGLAGSPSAVLTRNAGEHAMDIAAIQYGSLLRRNNLQTQADITRWQGGQARTASYFNAASDVVSGATNAVRFGRSPFA